MSIHAFDRLKVKQGALLMRGRHAIKVGVTVLALQEHKGPSNNPNRELTHDSTQDFLNNVIDSDYFWNAKPLTGAA